MRAIYCPGPDRWVSLGNYVRGVRKAIQNPAAVFPYGLTTWGSTTGEEIRRQFWIGVQDRINQAVPYVERGIKAGRDRRWLTGEPVYEKRGRQ